MKSRKEDPTHNRLLNRSKDHQKIVVAILECWMKPLSDPAFIAKHRTKETDFSRTRLLPFFRVFLSFLISFAHSSARQNARISHEKETGSGGAFRHPLFRNEWALRYVVEKYPEIGFHGTSPRAFFTETFRNLTRLGTQLPPVFTRTLFLLTRPKTGDAPAPRRDRRTNQGVAIAPSSNRPQEEQEG